MLRSGFSVSENPLKIKPEDVNNKSNSKVFPKSHVLTRDVSMGNFPREREDYHGDASASIPFTWESQPGTPKKIMLHERPLPPLTPPPSYFYAAPEKRRPSSTTATPRRHSKPSLLATIFPKLASRKTCLPVSPGASISLSSSSSSSSFSSRSSSPWSNKSHCYSVPSSPGVASKFHGLYRMSPSSPRKSLDGHDDDDEYESPVSTLCFATGCGGVNSRYRGWYSAVMKLKVLLRDVQ